MPPLKSSLLGGCAILILTCLSAGAQESEKPRRVSTPPPTDPPFEAVDMSDLPAGTKQLELFLLMGQSNMKGRGVMPDTPSRNRRILLMHLRDDQWYLARHPLHLVGDAQTFDGADNAGVGPGLAFAESYAALHEKSAIGLIPCAVGGSPMRLWTKGAKLYEHTVRRAKLALQTHAALSVRIRGALWLQGEANANANDLPTYPNQLKQMIEDLRADLEIPDLPFVACTIGEMGDETQLANKAAMNQLLLALPSVCANSACVDARKLTTHIGDNVHFDTPAQEKIGELFAAEIGKLHSAPFHWVSPLTPQERSKQSLPATVQHATFKSPSMGIDVGYYIYLPPDYEAGTERFPVVYHLHGGRPGGEHKSVTLASYVDKAIESGTIKPTIYVFPNGGPFSWYDMPEMKYGMGESVFVNELVPHVDTTYRTWGTRAGRALEGYSQGGRGTTRIMFKHPELFLSVAPGGSGYEPEKRIQENAGHESETLCFKPLGYNTWDLAQKFALRTDAPELSMLLWDGTQCFNYAYNLKYSAYLTELGIRHKFLRIDGVGHTAIGSYDKHGHDIMLHHQQTFAAHRR